MVLLEAEVHSSLLGFLRKHNRDRWVHHLTMARIISRALRLQRSSLIQTGSTITRYCLSYLTPALLSDLPVILVAQSSVQQRLLAVEIPQLQQWLQTDKVIEVGDRWPRADFQGLMLVSPSVWLGDRIENQGRFPDNILTLIEQAYQLEEWTRDYLTTSITAQNWDELMINIPHCADVIRDQRVKLTKDIFSHPKNPYQCHLIESREREYLQQFLEIIAPEIGENSPFIQFNQLGDKRMLWASIEREKGQFTLHNSPIQVNSYLSLVWTKQPIVLMGGFLDSDKQALIYRKQLGLNDLLCLKFAPSRSNEYIQLYLPDRLPLPNTPQFQAALIQQLHTLVSLCNDVNYSIVILVDDVPLKAQVGTILAAQFGSRVVVEKTKLNDNSILVCGWTFWHQNQENFPTPKLLVIATLPIPSLENPLVAAQVAYYKHQHQDWFRLYLLPTALKEIQRAVMPLRESNGVVALFDNRVNSRSYGSQILTALEPYARINYIDVNWFG